MFTAVFDEIFKAFSLVSVDLIAVSAFAFLEGKVHDIDRLVVLNEEDRAIVDMVLCLLP